MSIASIRYVNVQLYISIGGLVVEYSPATRVTRVRFPADANIFVAFLPVSTRYQFRKFRLKHTLVDKKIFGVLRAPIVITFTLFKPCFGIFGVFSRIYFHTLSI